MREEADGANWPAAACDEGLGMLECVAVVYGGGTNNAVDVVINAVDCASASSSEESESEFFVECFGFATVDAAGGSGGGVGLAAGDLVSAVATTG